MSIEWDSLILRGNELKTVGPATENARRANSVRTHSTNSRGAPAERIGLAGAATATVKMSWRYGGVDVVSTLWVSTAVLNVYVTFYISYYHRANNALQTSQIAPLLLTIGLRHIQIFLCMRGQTSMTFALLPVSRRLSGYNIP